MNLRIDARAVEVVVDKRSISEASRSFFPKSR